MSTHAYDVSCTAIYIGALQLSKSSILSWTYHVRKQWKDVYPPLDREPIPIECLEADNL